MSFYEAVKRECGLYFKDKWLLSSVLIVPFFTFIILVGIFGDGQVKNLPIGVVDFDNSSSSRELIRHFNASNKIYVHSLYDSEPQALKAVKSGEINAYVSIPYNLHVNIKKGLSPVVSSFYNTQFILIGRGVDTAIKQALGTYNAQLSIGKAVAKGNVRLEQALGSAIVFQQQITPLFNIEFSYAKFLLSVIIPCVWQVLIVATIVLNLVAQRRITGLKKWIEIGLTKAFLSKLFVHITIMLLWCIGFILYFYEYLEWPMNGSYLYIFVAGFLCTLASDALGFGIYFSSYNSTMALSSTASIVASCLAFVGITFPVTDMSPFAKTWSDLLPVTHYMNIQISQANYGADITITTDNVYFLLGFNLLFAISILSARKSIVKKNL